MPRAPREREAPAEVRGTRLVSESTFYELFGVWGDSPSGVRGSAAAPDEENFGSFQRKNDHFIEKLGHKYCPDQLIHYTRPHPTPYTYQCSHNLETVTQRDCISIHMAKVSGSSRVNGQIKTTPSHFLRRSKSTSRSRCNRCLGSNNCGGGCAPFFLRVIFFLVFFFFGGVFSTSLRPSGLPVRSDMRSE